MLPFIVHHCSVRIRDMSQLKQAAMVSATLELLYQVRTTSSISEFSKIFCQSTKSSPVIQHLCDKMSNPEIGMASKKETEENAASGQNEDPMYTAIKAAGKDVPRYLFRTWSPSSGGNSALNTATQITPLAFLNKKGPESIFDVEPSELRDVINGHLSWQPIPTFFSSWSDSIAYALSAGHGVEGSHLAIVDATRLPQRNNIHWCGSPHLGQFCSAARYPEEYHIFGIITGEAYKAVRIDQSTALAAGPPPAPYPYYFGNIQPAGGSTEPDGDLIEKSKEFGKDYALVVATFLLSRQRVISTDVKLLDRLLTTLPVPEDLDKFQGMLLHPKSESWTETRGAVNALEALMERSSANKRLEEATEDSTQEAESTAEDRLEEAVADSNQEAEPTGETKGGKSKGSAAEGSAAAEEKWTRSKGPANHIPKTARMTKEQYDLYIDMVGWK